MTRDQALTLGINDIVWVYDHGINEVFEVRIYTVRLEASGGPGRYPKDGKLYIEAVSKATGCRVFEPQEICLTEADALKRQSDLLQHRADKLLNDKHALDNKILKLKAGRD